jgi:hypothetical protein
MECRTTSTNLTTQPSMVWTSASGQIFDVADSTHVIGLLGLKIIGVYRLSNHLNSSPQLPHMANKLQPMDTQAPCNLNHLL